MYSKDNSISSIVNCFTIIDYINNNKNNGINNISSGTQIPKTTVHRIVQTLLKINILILKDNNSYSLGPKFAKYKINDDYYDILAKIADIEMKKIANKVGETVNLWISFNNTLYKVHTVTGNNYVLQMQPRSVSPLYCSASGKMFLYNFNEKNLKKYFNQDLEKYTDNTMTSAEELKTEFEKFEKDGVFFDNEEFEYGLYCVAAPVINNKNEIIASLSISGPKNRLYKKNVDLIANTLKTSAKIISDELKHIKFH